MLSQTLSVIVGPLLAGKGSTSVMRRSVNPIFQHVPRLAVRQKRYKQAQIQADTQKLLQLLANQPACRTTATSSR